jgi:hypothetical protein
MIVGRLIGVILAVLVSVAGCATMSVPRDSLERPAPVQVDPAQIYNDPLQGP